MNWYIISLFRENDHPQTRVYGVQADSAADVITLVEFNLAKSTPRQATLYGVSPSVESFASTLERFNFVL
jgi:hypothetical protein